MAYLDFLFGDEEQRKAAMGASPAGSPSSSPGMSAPAVSGAPAQQNASPQGAGGPNSRGTGFVNFGTLLGLNAGGAEDMAGRLTDSVNGQGQAAQDSINGLAGQYRASGAQSPFAEWAGPKLGAAQGQASEAAARARVLGSGGQGTLLRDVYSGPQTSGGNALDAALSGAAGGNAFRASASRYGGLDRALGLVGNNPLTAPSGSGGEGGGGGEAGGGGAMGDESEPDPRGRPDILDELQDGRVDRRSNPSGSVNTGPQYGGGGGILDAIRRGRRVF